MRSVRGSVLFLSAALATFAADGVVSSGALAADVVPERVEFNRDVRPILADVCFHCHGPDKSKRQADLHFDTEEGALAALGDGRHAIVRGKPEQSELIARITSDVPEQRMPPPDAERQLTPRQVATLRRWIEQGAKWEKHWAYVAPKRPVVPDASSSAWSRGPIDRFVLTRLAEEKLAPSPEAERTTLLRRATLDLTGLPPTPDEVADFLADASPAAFDRVVDRLLASPRFGERMASRWLDGARYADTSGYQSDGDRIMWRWRDWVIDAYNANMPFDRFTVEQIAGDLLPGATTAQKLATGFNRNHRGNGEGGIIPEEYAVEYVVDRVETTSTVWLGSTMMCVRCHSHKYDPFAQKEFYQLFAFFNNVPEKGRAVKYGNSPPYLLTPTKEQQSELDRLDAAIAIARRDAAAMQGELAAARAEWEKSGAANVPAEWSFSRGLSLHLPLEGTATPAYSAASANAKPAGYLGQLRLLETPTDAEKKKYEEKGDPAFAVGRFGQALSCNGTHYAAAGDVANFGFFDRFSFSFWVKPEGEAGGTILSRMVDVPRGSGWSVLLDKGRLQVHLSQRFLDDACRSEAAEPLKSGQWHHVVVTYDGSRDAGGIGFILNGQPVKTVILLDELNQTFAVKEPLRIGAGNGPQGRFHGLIDEVRIFDRVLTESEAALLATPEPVSDIARIASGKRTAGQVAKIERCFLETAAADEARSLWTRGLDLAVERERYIDALPTTMVMAEMETPRATHILLRGEYDKPGERVEPGVPASLTPWPKDAPRNRLGLAQWLVSPENPLTARVAVNRLWQQVFGTGIVKTVDDFGTQGEWPSHPELLDWLAVEFIADCGLRIADSEDDSAKRSRPSTNPQSAIRIPQSPPAWDIKRLLREIVTSSTYRQTSRAGAELIQRDPENRQLARGPRFRLPAEMIRDQALTAGGLLVERLGGPSVKPYQPEGLYKDLAGSDYEQGHGDDLYRRSLYTFWKRTIAPPAMMTFDAAGRETCIVKETRTNTPLQALNLMNDVTYVEASRFLAERMLRDANDTPARIRRGMLLLLGREPSPREMQILTAGLERHRQRYESDRAAAEKLTQTGERPRDATLNVAELAAWTTLANLIHNLDEAVTRE